MLKKDLKHIDSKVEALQLEKVQKYVGQETFCKI